MRLTTLRIYTTGPRCRVSRSERSEWLCGGPMQSSFSEVRQPSVDVCEFLVPGGEALTVAELCASQPGLVFPLGAAPNLGAVWPEQVTWFARRNESTRPIAVRRTPTALCFSLLTPGCCTQTWRLAASVIAEAARRTPAQRVLGPHEAYSPEGFEQRHSRAWCREQASIGFSRIRESLAEHPESWARLQTMTGSVLLSPQRAYALGSRVGPWTRLFRRRAWIHRNAREAPLRFDLNGAWAARSIVVGQRLWVDRRALWIHCAELDGYVGIDDLIDAYGADAMAIDDGCFVLGALSPRRAASVLTRWSAHALAEPVPLAGDYAGVQSPPDVIGLELVRPPRVVHAASALGLRE